MMNDLNGSIKQLRKSIKEYRDHENRELIFAQCDSLLFLLDAFESNLRFLELMEKEKLRSTEYFDILVKNYSGVIRNIAVFEDSSKEAENACIPFHAMCEVIYGLNMEIEKF